MDLPYSFRAVRVEGCNWLLIHLVSPTPAFKLKNINSYRRMRQTDLSEQAVLAPSKLIDLLKTGRLSGTFQLQPCAKAQYPSQALPCLLL